MCLHSYWINSHAIQRRGNRTGQTLTSTLTFLLEHLFVLGSKDKTKKSKVFSIESRARKTAIQFVLGVAGPRLSKCEILVLTFRDAPTAMHCYPSSTGRRPGSVRHGGISAGCGSAAVPVPSLTQPAFPSVTGALPGRQH